MNIRKIIFSLMVLVIIPFAPLKAIGGFGIQGTYNMFSVGDTSSAMMVENPLTNNMEQVGEFSIDGFNNGGGFGGYAYFDAIPFGLALEAEGYVSVSPYTFSFKNALMNLDSANAALVSGAYFVTIRKELFKLKIPFLAKAKLLAGVGINKHVRTPLVSQEMFEAVVSGGDLENGEFETKALIDYLDENRIKSEGYHAQAGIQFKVLMLDSFLFARYTMAENLIPDQDGFASVHLRIGVGF
ncbi:MAG: hypothetical protein HOK94_08830 [Candidatus Marinimicrobia bacterium]|jgi:hypothetical protein|nr:hypothetical protein [Candidatus Neomarinimicrobiota bacterium]MBT5364057.1 hypothetical protein [Candidatus Neomarinimicrobiota bacterium]MBT5461738.1 hypothetical protein [Candidatus Neomarinimicrobiota bacterium]MBT5758309.1 hypothetical protein [Candidatus Neomarinimicrobiota bacterium]MBT7113514.1 hypothetical protein [Candidatus Neomarinimicrobiota bacterium]